MRRAPRVSDVNDCACAGRVKESRTSPPPPPATRRASCTPVPTARVLRQPRRTPRGAAAQPGGMQKRTGVAHVLPALVRTPRLPPRPVLRHMLTCDTPRARRSARYGARAQPLQAAACATSNAPLREHRVCTRPTVGAGWRCLAPDYVPRRASGSGGGEVAWRHVSGPKKKSDSSHALRMGVGWWGPIVTGGASERADRGGHV